MASPVVAVEFGRPEQCIPLVCDSPHSGVHYPADFDHAIALAQLRSAEDTHLDRLWNHAPAVGGTLVAAHFPRTYIDANHALADLDTTMLAEPWPGPAAASPPWPPDEGLICRQLRTGTPIYQRRLTVAEVRHRIETCWMRYRATVRAACDIAARRFGGCWHLNLHALPQHAGEPSGPAAAGPPADFVLGDRQGSSCDAAFVGVVRHALQARGYRVALNPSSAGQDLVRLMGRPGEGRHSLQVGIRRSLYLDEATRAPGARFHQVRADLAGTLEEIARHIRARGSGPDRRANAAACSTAATRSADRPTCTGTDWPAR